MAYADRDYYRDTDDRDWSFLPGRVTMICVVALLIIFILQVINRPGVARPDRLLVAGAFSYDLIISGEVWRFILAPLLHDSNHIFPIACLLVTLYLCGRWMEDELGAREYIAYLVFALVMTQLAEFIARATNVLPRENPTFGSIGIVTAVLLLAAFRHPRATVYFFVFPVPMYIVGILWVILSTIRLDGFQGRDDLARVLAGVAIAAAYHKMGARLSGGRRYHSTARERPRLRVVHPDDAEPDRDLDDADQEPVAARSRPESRVDEHLEAQVDHVLEKISKTGIDSLNASEKAILDKAREVYRKRRGN
jgi:membrane associated rhomboid family serine protease